LPAASAVEAGSLLAAEVAAGIRPEMVVEVAALILLAAAVGHILAAAGVAQPCTLLQAGALPMPSPVPRFITLPRAERQHRT
jgi:hypothetical protein